MALRSTLFLLAATTMVSARPAVPRAEALRVEGIKQRDTGAHDQALANFLAAYAIAPGPELLLDIASTLRDLGRLADAANTYQRYLLDPASDAERAAEIEPLLRALDAQLTILTIRVPPGGSELSIDGGPFVAVGSSLRTRVRPGLHLVRVRKAHAIHEITVHGVEGETRQVTAMPPGPSPASPTEPMISQAPIPDQVEGWLIAGTQDAVDPPSSRARTPRVGVAGSEIPADAPPGEISVTDTPSARAPAPAIRAGVIGVVRIDGEGRGFAGGLGLALARGRFAADLMILKSDEVGGYVGLRYRLLQGWVRPYVGAGMPAFAYEHAGAGGLSTAFAFGVRGAAGVELMLNHHFSVHADLGYEHFFVDTDTLLDANIFVPSVGVIGRL